ncbi:formate-dependent phosphoribosylglycinamide formyltransferase [Prochlorococcus sp. MIT 1341]|uniref:formate-dependent phosphoribosylglycinamide formyltransferase n=1 Tax=Prochlorococcus sp. MIT 1341 TaxID=3096221 RepID=UPI002A748542|nr:formate-dependent phosphoribosylglycinamide formyltransferase [Prochlorococcus sp. MIT 1341]
MEHKAKVLEMPKTLMLLGSGELGKEIIIAAQRIGCITIACDRYRSAPAMQVADKFEIVDMTNQERLEYVINKHKPDIIIPEIEALAVDCLKRFEKEGITIIPTARATATTMNRDLIRDLAVNELQLETAKFKYANSAKELKEAAQGIGLPVIIKPIMSSSGKGQSLIEKKEDLEQGWQNAIQNARGKSKKIIVEEFLKFELEITLLTIRQKDGSTIFCPPIGHIQKNGDYQCSWQPANLKAEQLIEAQEMAKKITENLGGTGLFGVEFFITNTKVIFSELSPRPHDTGLVTLISQNLNEFELHIRAILGLPIPKIINKQASASRVILAKKKLKDIRYQGLDDALRDPNSEILLFGKPDAKEGRRMGVALAKGENIIEACNRAEKAAQTIKVLGSEY